MKQEYYICFQIQQGGRYIGGLQIFPEQLLIDDEWLLMNDYWWLIKGQRETGALILCFLYKDTGC